MWLGVFVCFVCFYAVYVRVFVYEKKRREKALINLSVVGCLCLLFCYIVGVCA